MRKVYLPISRFTRLGNWLFQYAAAFPHADAVAFCAATPSVREALAGLDAWEAAAIDAALEPLPEALDMKKRLVFQAVRVAVCGNMVSPPLGETMALVGREDCLARIDRARTMAL